MECSSEQLAKNPQTNKRVFN